MIDKILTYSLTEIADKIKSGEITSRQTVKACLDRIENTKDINALITVADRDSLLNEAAKADEEIKNGNKKGLLKGVPVVVKDNMCTLTMPTTCASKVLRGFTSPYEATVITKLKEQGAIIIGKANMDEFAMGSSNETSAYGKVLNPIDKTRVPGGSSGGSAATVAAYQCYASLGSDTGGSIRLPSAFCGVVGLKPTYGRVSRRGLIAFGSSLDQIGPITRTVRDSALMMDVISGYDPNDNTSVDIKDDKPFRESFGDSIKGMKIGIAGEFMGLGMDEDIKSSVNKLIDFYKENGAEIVDVELPNIDVALDVFYILASAECSSNLSRYDGIRYGDRAENYTDLIDMYYKTRTELFGEEVKRRIILGNYVLSSGFYDAYYKKASDVREKLKTHFAKAFSKCDVILAPTSPFTAFKFGAKSTPLQMYLSDIYTVPVNIVGCPAISFPVGKDRDNLPIGIQLIGNTFNEAALFKLADFYERGNK